MLNLLLGIHCHMTFVSLKGIGLDWFAKHSVLVYCNWVTFTCTVRNLLSQLTLWLGCMIQCI